MSYKLWIGDRMYCVDPEVVDYVDELRTENERLLEALLSISQQPTTVPASYLIEFAKQAVKKGKE